MNNAPAEISSGKDTAYENFPVGSWLLPANLRPHIATFYNFARAADDIADSAILSPEAKISRLNHFEEALTGKISGEAAPQKAVHMATSLQQTQTTLQHGLDLLAAFKQDATKHRYNTWQELLDYCLLSASPVGRYLIDLHGGFRDRPEEGLAASDALCNALQILNHLQDCQEDYQTLDRIYLPLDIMARHQTKVEDLDATKTSTSLRGCLNEILDGVEALMQQAAKLPPLPHT